MLLSTSSPFKSTIIKKLSDNTNGPSSYTTTLCRVSQQLGKKTKQQQKLQPFFLLDLPLTHHANSLTNISSSTYNTSMCQHTYMNCRPLPPPLAHLSTHPHTSLTCIPTNSPTTDQRRTYKYAGSSWAWRWDHREWLSLGWQGWERPDGTGFLRHWDPGRCPETQSRRSRSEGEKIGDQRLPQRDWTCLKSNTNKSCKTSCKMITIFEQREAGKKKGGRKTSRGGRRTCPLVYCKIHKPIFLHQQTSTYCWCVIHYCVLTDTNSTQTFL